MARARGIGRKRVAERLQAAIADLIRTGMGDSRLELVTVTDARVDRELEQANIWVCAPALKDDRREQVLEALAGARGFIRRELAGRLRMRRMPRLEFHWDFTPDHAAQIEKLIDGVAAPNERPNEGGTAQS